MTDAARFGDIYNRLNDLTLDVRNLKIETGTLGSLQVTVSQILNIIIAMQADMTSVKRDISELKNQNSEIIRLLRGLNGTP